ncbi:hypothetical protein GCM10023115_54070 [Pontixanthobacter gangjinensis]|uniref:Uncharacterized protein n=1 Tax=Pontixanthobacter gangjinensis TaxID=1028742 RepID=A0A6I4SRC1_9SPHN|nr:hypothetical protein [Pontixanthobacter gangjinensis]MXO57690.1 hypothetical protein [Pontixanthobacter gangjinensis]
MEDTKDTSILAERVNNSMVLRNIAYVGWIWLLIGSPIDEALAIVLCSVSFLLAWAVGSKNLYQQYGSAARDLIIRSGILITIFTAPSFANVLYDLQFNKFIAIVTISVAGWLVLSRYRLV